MIQYEQIRKWVIGAPLDPLSQSTRQHIALAAFIAWVGLGADGLSSSAYGPEEAFKALGDHTQLGLYMAIATAATVFIISLAYNQVIELFPTGGGGYRVATSLIGPRAGLVSGAALIVDYVLTIAISVASGIDALFSLLPTAASDFKLGTELVLVVVLLVMNMRGMKESIRFLLPIFLGFFVTHVFLIAYGILGHSHGLTLVVPNALAETSKLAHDIGWVAALSLFLVGKAVLFVSQVIWIKLSTAFAAWTAWNKAVSAIGSLAFFSATSRNLGENAATPSTAALRSSSVLAS